MKKTALLFLLEMAFVTNVIAQMPDGRYYENGDYISFKSDTVLLKVQGLGGITVDLYASGTYEIIDSFLIVKAGQFDGFKSDHTTTKNQGSETKVLVLDPDGKPIPYCNVKLMDKSDKMISGTTTNEEGIATIYKSNTVARIDFSALGYDNYSVEFLEQLDYQIVLTNYRVIENQTIVFFMNSINDDKLNLILLTTDFKNKGSINSRKKALNKLLRKEEKLGTRERVFVKEKGL